MIPRIRRTRWTTLHLVFRNLDSRPLGSPQGVEPGDARPAFAPPDRLAPREHPPTPRLRRGLAEALRGEAEACQGVRGAKPLGVITGKAAQKKTRASAAKRATRAERAWGPPRGVRGAKPLGVITGKAAQKKMRASAAKRATRTERAGEAARERACKGVRGAKPLGVITDEMAARLVPAVRIHQRAPPAPGRRASRPARPSRDGRAILRR